MSHPPLPEYWGAPISADQLQQWRKARRVSQSDLAEWLGLSRKTIMRWETYATEVPPFLHLALESIDRRLSFEARPPARPATTSRKKVSGAANLALAREALARQLEG